MSEAEVTPIHCICGHRFVEGNGSDRCPKCTRSLTPAQVRTVRRRPSSTRNEAMSPRTFSKIARDLVVILEPKGLTKLASKGREFMAEFDTWEEVPPPDSSRFGRLQELFTWSRESNEALTKGKP